MNCPICNVQLVMTERQEIEIDYCPKCRGVWLDRGELDKILERSNSESSQAQYRERDYEPHDKKRDNYHEDEHYRGHYKRKRSFLFDLFD